jgi:glycosyltransferase involved in cell wall biosynthesis
MPDPCVSVIMPFYNAENSLGAAVNSICRQTYTDWELLLCDDGATDRSSVVARSCSDRRIRAWSDGRDLTLGARLNECVDRATDSFIAPMDADDVSYPTRIEQQLRFLQSHPEVDVVSTQAVVFRAGGVPIGKWTAPLTHNEIVSRPRLGFRLCHPAWMGRTEWFRQNRYRSEAVRCEDIDLLTPDTQYAAL